MSGGYNTDTNTFCYLHEGTMDWPAIVGALRKYGYDGNITAELWSKGARRRTCAPSPRIWIKFSIAETIKENTKGGITIMAERLKAALVGVGSMGRGHLDNYVKLLKEDSDIEIVALCDIDEKKFTNYKADFNLGPVGEDGYDFDKFRLYTDLDEMLEKETALDMVTIALPTYLHAWGTIKCLNKGINVLCESRWRRPTRTVWR